MKIVLTGGSGFLGSYVSELLEEKSFIYENLSLENGYDLTNWETIKNISGFDAIIHLASKIYVPDSFKNPRSFFFNNLNSTFNCLELCRINKVKMIFISSYVYGKPAYLPVDEKHNLVGHNPYSDSKILSEKLCQSYFDNFGVKTVILRPFNIYGAGQKGDLLIPSICSQLQNSEIILQDPLPKRDYIYVSDVANAILATLTKNFEQIEYINIGTSLSYSVDEIVEKIIQISGSNAKKRYLSQERAKEVSDVKADISKAQNLLNWSPKIGIHEGLELVVKSL